MRGGLNLCSPSTTAKVNCLFIRCLRFEGVRGDLQEGHSYASRCQFPVRPSTKLPFLCAFALRNPYFRVFQAQKGLFCVRKGNFFQVLSPPEHKIEVFVLGLLLSLASGRAIKKRVTSKSPNGLFSYPPLWIGICSGALESINSAKLEIAPVYVINYSVLVLNGETPVIVEHILETGSKIKGKSTLCILASRRV